MNNPEQKEKTHLPAQMPRQDVRKGASGDCPFILPRGNPSWMITAPNDNDDDYNGEAAAADDNDDDDDEGI